VLILEDKFAKIVVWTEKCSGQDLEGRLMSEERYPGWYSFIKEKHGIFIRALEQLGEAVRQEGPLDNKTAHLVQLAGAAASRSEGSVHSHTRRALKAGATPEEIYHSVILLTSTIGFPSTSAALSWVYDVLGEEA
jgi:4-carboxymuconolactone decarboxylase